MPNTRVRRWRRVALAAAATLLPLGGLEACSSASGQGTRSATPPAHATARGAASSPAGARSSPPPPTPSVVGGKPSVERRLQLAGTITGHITPKSVVASGRGLIFAQNMMYTHTITVYDRSGRLVRTIPDTVRLADFGFPRFTGDYQGAPVEAAFTPDGTHAYVSNYSMYGPDLRHEGHDTCSPGSGSDDSFVYRVDTRSLKIDQVIAVGAVPKYVAVSPDGKTVLVTNWCSYSLSIIDAATGRQRKQVSLGPYPRGIVVEPDSRTAWIAVMGTTRLAKVDLRTYAVTYFPVGAGPRHLVRDAAGRWLYATLNSEGRIAKIDARTGRVVTKVATGSAPRSMAISADGGSLYVVNYDSGTVSKVRTSDMTVLQTVPTRYHPIGISFDDGTGDVWVACYSGSIMHFRDV